MGSEMCIRDRSKDNGAKGGSGAINMMYMSISSDTNIVKVAEDARNVGPIFIVACCSDPVQAEAMYLQLIKDPIGPPPGWKPKPGSRPPPEQLQYKYVCSRVNAIIVGGPRK